MPRRLTIEIMREVARERGGECLSNTYTNAETKLRWRCAKGHEWETMPKTVKTDGKWCPECGGKTKLTIGEMLRIANDRGGKCLSGTYAGVGTKLLWQCASGHEWWARPSEIKNRGQWCPKCAGNAKLNIEMMQEMADRKGGKCLSTEYAGTHTKLLWRCADSHEWWARPLEVKNRDSWCPKCAGNARLTIEEMQAIAGARGGVCLSEGYTNITTDLLWRCALGHEWSAMPASIKHQGSWCPHCRLKNEQKCRETFEARTGKKFPKLKPAWLEGLELDGYCEELGIAFEYNGRQHYEVLPAWHENGMDDLEQQQARDAKKVRLCEKNWVALVVIPYDMKDNDAFIGKQLADIFG